MTAEINASTVNEAQARMVGGVAACAPYVVGFPPRRSVVAQAVVGGCLGAAVRFDVDAPTGMVGEVVVKITADDPAMYLVGFEDVAGESAATVEVAREALEGVGLSVHTGTVRDGWVTGPGGWSWPLTHFEHVAAPFVAAGVSPMASWEDIAASLNSGESPAGLVEALEDAPPEGAPQEACVAAWARVFDPQGPEPSGLPVQVLCDAVAGLRSVTVRDALAAALWRGMGEMREAIDAEVMALVDAAVMPIQGGDAALAAHRMAGMARVVPQGADRAQVLGFLGAGFWQAGDGVRARILCEEAAQAGNRLALLVGQMIEHGVRPGSI